MGYLNKTSGIYLTRENEPTLGVESAKAYVQMDISSGTTLQVEIRVRVLIYWHI